MLVLAGSNDISVMPILNKIEKGTLNKKNTKATMNKCLIRVIGGTICLLVLIFSGILVYDNYLGEQEDLRRPNNLGTYYQDLGYFKINPKTILISLESGDANIFTPLLEDTRNIEELTDITISWTQADFLKIASALGQVVWDDPMDFKDWSVYSVNFSGRCGDPIGLDSASIAYFKIGGNSYTTRIIEIYPYFGWVSWGDGKAYPKPVLRRWKNVDLFGAKITADDAIRIVNGDVKARFLAKNDPCWVLIGWPESNDYKNWNLDISLGPLGHIVYLVNLDTGDFIVKNRR